MQIRTILQCLLACVYVAVIHVFAGSFSPRTVTVWSLLRSLVSVIPRATPGMQVGCSSAVTGLKPPRTAVFQGEFALLLREFIVSLSAYVRAQLELVGEDGQLELPVEMVTL